MNLLRHPAAYSATALVGIHPPPLGAERPGLLAPPPAAFGGSADATRFPLRPLQLGASASRCMRSPSGPQQRTHRPWGVSGCVCMRSPTAVSSGIVPGSSSHHIPFSLCLISWDFHPWRVSARMTSLQAADTDGTGLRTTFLSLGALLPASLGLPSSACPPTARTHLRLPDSPRVSRLHVLSRVWYESWDRDWRLNRRLDVRATFSSAR